jgi:acyl phosphate:glycerol-3-phosphate acyltransferase
MAGAGARWRAPATRQPNRRSTNLYSTRVDDLPLTLSLLLTGYLMGSLPMGVIVARVTGGIDPRTVGSGRTGGTNMLRAGGWGRAIAVAALDLSKGAVPILVARALEAPVEVQALTGLAAVLGSWKSVFLRFGGGRGVATGVGGMLAIAPWIVPLALPAFIIIIGTTRYVSLGSILGTAFGAGIVVLAVLAGWLEPGWLLYAIPGVVIVWLAHRDNIGRLLDGSERKLSSGDRQPTPPPGR